MGRALNGTFGPNASAHDPTHLRTCPRRGGPSRPLLRLDELASATVIGPSLGTADALATAVFAAGDADVGWLARFEAYGAVLVRADGSLSVTGQQVDVVG